MRSDDGFEVRLVAVAPGRSRAYDEPEWRDALVIVERGQIELEGLNGSRQTFECGDVLWLAGLRLRAVHNRGREPALMVAVSRASDEFSTAPRSYVGPRRRGAREP